MSVTVVRQWNARSAGLEEALGYQIPFDKTEYDGWGNEPELDIFSSPIVSYETVARDIGTLVEDGHYNSKFYDSGLTKEAVRALYQEMKRSCPEWGPRSGQPTTRLCSA